MINNVIYYLIEMSATLINLTSFILLCTNKLEGVDK